MKQPVTEDGLFHGCRNKKGTSTREAMGQGDVEWFGSVGGHAVRLVGSHRSLDQVLADFGFELLPHRLHGLTPLVALFRSQLEDLAGARLDDGLASLAVQLIGLAVDLL